MPEFDVNYFLQRMFSEQADFASLRDELWAFQYAQNPILRQYADGINAPRPVSLPISFFKHFPLKNGDSWEPQTIFESSGTSGQTPSRHLVRDLQIYQQSLLSGFYHRFAERQYRVFALLPSYLERQTSSLVYMSKHWMDTFGLPGSGFYLYNFDELQQGLYEASEAGEPIILIGVAFALLDFVERFAMALPADTIVIETGGMKGRKEEIVRSELHQILRQGFGIPQIHSEYGMTELLSQAYTREDGRFVCPPWMRVHCTDIHLNTLLQPPGISGRLHIVDLANIHSCAFIATDDIGRVYEDGSFEVLGRLDNAEMRGCSLMYV
ncbi:MAG: acyl transferase [Bacteroidota bacterium]